MGFASFDVVFCRFHYHAGSLVSLANDDAVVLGQRSKGSPLNAGVVWNVGAWGDALQVGG